MVTISYWQRLLRWLTHEDASYLFATTTERMRQTAPAPSPQYRMVLCTTQNLAEMQHALENFPPVIAEGMAHGDLAILAVAEGHIIARASAVLGPQRYQAFGHEFTLGETEAYIENVETETAWREQGVAHAVITRLADELHARGMRDVCLLVHIKNTPSIHLFEKCGCTRRGVLISRRVFGHWQSQLAVLGGLLLATTQFRALLYWTRLSAFILEN